MTECLSFLHIAASGAAAIGAAAAAAGERRDSQEDGDRLDAAGV